MAAREQMSKVDTAWLRMDRPSNLMMISGVLIFRDPLDFAHLQAIVSERFLEQPRFRQRPVETPAGTFWEEDPAFDLDRHVLRVRLGRSGWRAQLQSLMSELIAKPLDQSRPLWQF